MSRIRSLSIIILALTLTGCVAEQSEQLRTDTATAEKTLAAATQATASAKDALATLPPNSPGYTQAARVVASSEKAEQTARLALDAARAALDAVAKNDANDPALRQSLAAAIGAIPSPWTPMLAALVPAAIPLLVSVVQSVKLGRAHQNLADVTRELEEHRAAAESVRDDVERENVKT